MKKTSRSVAETKVAFLPYSTPSSLVSVGGGGGSKIFKITLESVGRTLTINIDGMSTECLLKFEMHRLRWL